MMVRNILFAAFIVFACLTQSFSQGGGIKPRVSGLENDSAYMSLLYSESVLRKTEDSIVGIIAVKRAEFALDTTNRAIKGNEIIRLEGQLFNVRNNIGIVTSKASTIEQEFLMKSIRSENPFAMAPRTGSGEATNYTNLIRNSYFTENLNRAELELLPTDQQSINNLIDKFLNDYQKLENIALSYKAAAEPRQADSLFAEYQAAKADFKILEDSLKPVWNDVYGDKIYIYSYLLDKLRRSDELNRLNQKSKESRRYDSNTEVISKPFAEYPLQKSLVVDYEISLARALKLTNALDSLTAQQKIAEALNLALPKITLAQRDFAEYSDISIVLPAVYNSKNPIPDIEIPDYGTYYSVVLGTFSSPQAVTIFKGVTPLYKERMKDSRLRYFAGFFRTAGEALDAVQMLKDAGFKRPEPVMWKNGIYSNIAEAAAKGAGHFSVEISGIRGEIGENIKQTIARFTKNEELTRVGSTFSVGVFNNKLRAQELCDALNRIQGLTANVIDVDAN